MAPHQSYGGLKCAAERGYIRDPVVGWKNGHDRVRIPGDKLDGGKADARGSIFPCRFDEKIVFRQGLQLLTDSLKVIGHRYDEGVFRFDDWSDSAGSFLDEALVAQYFEELFGTARAAKRPEACPVPPCDDHGVVRSSHSVVPGERNYLMRGTQLDQEPLLRWIVPVDQGPTRLDAFVRRCVPHLSLREVRKAIDAGEFRLGDKPGKKGERLSGGEIVTFRGSPALLAPGPLPGWDLNVLILYEDESILVVDKPAGMATHGFSGEASQTLANFLAAKRPSITGVGKSRWEPGLVHRLDRDTSGIVLIAKKQEAFEDLRGQFRRRLVQKRYWALVWGKTKREGVVAYPLVHDRRDRRKMKALVEERVGGAEPRQWQAVTRFRRSGYSQGFSLVTVEMETGVTHQIRAHLAAIGHPIFGDWLYGGDRPQLSGLERQFLHACYLGFRHPESGQQVAFESPLPQELREVLNRLGIKL